nr:hypothetical protein NCC49_002753 [Naganishia albida]
MWKLFVGVGSVVEARAARPLVGADVVVAQGNEAGGHGSASSPPLLKLLPSIARALPSYKALNPTTKSLLLGAGGLSYGSHLAALIALGAHGAVYSTRFLLSPECTYSPTRNPSFYPRSTVRRKEAWLLTRREIRSIGQRASMDGES